MPSKPLTSAVTELKRYSIEPDKWDGFLEVWRDIVRVRRRFGFEILFALIDRKQNMFTWAISHDGDFDAAAAAYYGDPERVELEIVANYVTAFEVTRVTQESLP